MAERRMFSQKITGSSRFLRMPASSRLLYYDLGMNADDDGVVEAYTVLTMTKSSEDDLRVLVSKGFVRILNEDLVAQIMDWRVNNLIKGDRYHPSIYKDLMVQVGSDVDTKWNQVGTKLEPEVRLGKDRIGKVSKDKFTPPTLEEVEEFAKEKGYDVDAKRFFDYYANENWTDSKGQKVKNWKGRLATWERKKRNVANKEYEQRKVEDEDFSDLFLNLNEEI